MVLYNWYTYFGLAVDDKPYFLTTEKMFLKISIKHRFPQFNRCIETALKMDRKRFAYKRFTLLEYVVDSANHYEIDVKNQAST